MVIGGLGCAVGGVLLAMGGQATIAVGAAAANVLVRVVPLVVGAGLVSVGAAVRRAVRRAYALGAADAERRLRHELGDPSNGTMRALRPGGGA